MFSNTRSATRSRIASLAAVLACALSIPAFAASGAPTPAERGAAAKAFVSKWGAYVERVYDVPVGVWAQRMVPTFVAADGNNLRNALRRNTFEGALNELQGTGHRLRDDAVIERFARANAGNGPAARKQRAAAGKAPTDLRTLISMRDVGTETLGSTTNDLVFTPVQPCRVVDTRVAGGAIAADGSRSFIAVAVSAGTGFAFQGGSSTDCGVAAVGASAVVLNVTAVTPSSAGFATIYQHGTTRPLAASVNYAANAIVNNTVIVRIPNPLGVNDFTIYTFGQSHFVVDIVGYFSPPQATRLQCSDTAISTFTVAANTATFINNPSCPTGYDAITPYCYTNASGVYSRGSGYNSNTNGLATFCAWQNTTASTQQVFGGNVCCRIPGR